MNSSIPAHKAVIIKRATDFMKSIDVDLDSYQVSLEQIDRFPIYVSFKKPDSKHVWQVNLYSEHTTCTYFQERDWNFNVQ